MGSSVRGAATGCALVLFQAVPEFCTRVEV
jgi:hypothetical protein